MVWSRVIDWILPFDIYEDIREDIVGIYISAYRTMPDAREQYEGISDDRLRKWGRAQGWAAKNRDHAEDIKDVRDHSNAIWQVIRFVLVLFITIGALSGGGYLFLSSRDLLEGLGAVFNPLMALITGANSTIGGIAGLVFLYTQLLVASSAVVNHIRRRLVFEYARFETRQRSMIVGRGLWNKSLNGGSAIQLLAVFSALKILAFTRWWDPYTYVVRLIRNNMDAFDNDEGYISAIKKLYRRLRSNNLDEEKGQEGDERVGEGDEVKAR